MTQAKAARAHGHQAGSEQHCARAPGGERWEAHTHTAKMLPRVSSPFD